MSAIQKTIGIIIIVGVVTTAGTGAHALQTYQDRKGLFFGMGIGGGGVFGIPSGDVGGEGIYDLQLGGGATSNLTLALDTDISVIGFADEITLAIIPGPELTYFFGETGLYLRGGLGAALTVVWVDGGSGEFNAGFDADVGFGWEFFVRARFAMYLGLEAGYTVLQGDDHVNVGFMIGFKNY